MSQTATATPKNGLKGLSIERRFSTAGIHPFDEIEWEIRDAVIGDPENPAFEQRGVEFPKSWSQNATNIVAQKYFRGQLGCEQRESSVKQMIGRVAGTISDWGREGGYFASEEDAEAFEMELTSILLNQKAAFNSPVWFNVGFEETPQCSACFILSVEDTMESILDWNTKEGNDLPRRLRLGDQPLQHPRLDGARCRRAAPPAGRSASCAAPTPGRGRSSRAARRGGRRRWSSSTSTIRTSSTSSGARPTRRRRRARCATPASTCRSTATASPRSSTRTPTTRCGSPTSSWRRVEAGEDWDLLARNGGAATKTLPARELMNQIADAAWRCADPGVQYDTIINRWHTCPESGRINASNPCSEYMHVDDSACNLASLNLMKFRRDDGSFDVEDFEHSVDVVFLAQEIVVGFSSYPTEEITANANAFRQLGLGYANLGALLMSDGLPYDSDTGRNVAAAITALMTGRAYRQSALIAAGATGPYDEYEKNRDAHNGVMRMHRDASYDVDPTGIKGELLAAAQRSWDEAVELGDEHGYRNAQATVLAPTGTISFLMDCDTTGIEPDFSLVKFKELVGGGQMTIVNKSVPLALRTLGYAEPQVEQINAHIAAENTIVGAPGLERGAPAGLRRRGRRAGDLPHRPHRHDGRDPAVHLGRDLEDGQPAAGRDGRGHRRRLHPRLEGRAEGAGDLPRRLEDGAGAAHRRPGGKGGRGRAADPAPERKRMPRERESITHKFSIAGHEGYITAGKYDDGSVGEIFLTDIGKEGSTMRGLMNAFATAISLGLQYGVPLEDFVRKFSYMRFEPEGITGNPEIPFAKSLPDYIMRWVASRFIEDTETLEELGIMTQEVRAKQEAETSQLGLGIPTDTAGPANGGNGTRTAATAARSRSPRPRR